MEDLLDVGTIRTIARRFLLRNFSNVRSVHIIEIKSEYMRDRWLYKVRGQASINLESIIPILGSPIEVEVLVTHEGEVVTVQGQKWNTYHRVSERVLRRRHDTRRR